MATRAFTPREDGITRNQIISQLTRAPHGELSQYLPVGRVAAQKEPEFLAHLIAWDRVKGNVRDSKVALPVVALTVSSDEEFESNALAHIALLGPRELERAYRFALATKLPGKMRRLRRLVEDWLHSREENEAKWDRMAILHRKTLASLYALVHAKRSDRVGDILFKQKYPTVSIFETVGKLKDMEAAHAASVIIEERIPFLVALGALGKKSQDSDLVLALIKRMSPTELVTNTAMLEKMGVKTNPALREAFEAALEDAAKSKKNVLKTTRAAEVIEDAGLKQKMHALQERQLDSVKGIEGDWLVLGDKSGSMDVAIEATRQVSALLSRMVKGNVTVVFFDNAPSRVLEATGMTYEAIKEQTRHVTAGGGTSIGCGLQYVMDKSIEIDGIAIISDGGENAAPLFVNVYRKYCAMIGKDVPVYLYHCNGERDVFSQTMAQEHIDIQKFDLTGAKLDYTSLPNLVQTMRTSRYGLVDEIMSFKLLTLKEALKYEREGVEVNA